MFFEEAFQFLICLSKVNGFEGFRILCVVLEPSPVWD